jgi:hypothetical protein
MKRFVALFVGAAACVMAASAQAATVTQWNFNSVVPDANTGTGTTLPSTGVGTASLVGGITSSFSSGDANLGSTDPATGDDSGLQTTTYPAAATNDLSAGVRFDAPTVGYQNISIGYDLRHSNTSSRYEALQYSLDGVNFTTAAFFSGAMGDTWFNGRTADLSSIAGANNNPLFAFRVVAAFESSATGAGPAAYAASSTAYAPGGTWRFDMATVSGTLIPEPGSLALASLAGLALAFRRRR